MTYICITNNNIDLQDMITNRKASAYHKYAGLRVDKIEKNDLIFIYRTEKNSSESEKTGIIAYGYANGKKEILRACKSGLDSIEEDCAYLDKFTILEKAVSFAVLRSIHKKHSDKKFILANVTLKKLCEKFAKDLLNEIT